MFAKVPVYGFPLLEGLIQDTSHQNTDLDRKLSYFHRFR